MAEPTRDTAARETRRERIHRLFVWLASAGLRKVASDHRVQVEVAFIDPGAVAGGDPNPKVERYRCTVPELALWAFLDEWEGV